MHARSLRQAQGRLLGPEGPRDDAGEGEWQVPLKQKALEWATGRTAKRMKGENIGFPQGLKPEWFWLVMARLKPSPSESDLWDEGIVCSRPSGTLVPRLAGSATEVAGYFQWFLAERLIARIQPSHAGGARTAKRVVHARSLRQAQGRLLGPEGPRDDAGEGEWQVPHKRKALEWATGQHSAVS